MKILFTVDVEGAWSLLPSEQVNFDFNTVVKSLEILENVIELIENEFSQKLEIIWFLRCDNSIKKNFGIMSGFIKKIEKFISRRLDKGNLIGFHPHFYFENNKKNWIADKNENRIAEQFESSINEWKNHFGAYPKLSRMGEGIMNNLVSSLIEKYEIDYDFSCLPGRIRKDENFNFDWQYAPLTKYNPSIKNYMISDKKKFYKYFQVPFTMVEMPLNYRTVKRYLNLSYRPNLILNGLKKLCKFDYLVCVLHPHEIINYNKKL